MREDTVLGEMQLFENEQFGKLRVVDIDGEPWFVAKDICDALSIRTDSIRAILDDDEVTDVNPNSIGVKGKGRKPLVVSEAGLYSLIMKSRKEEAVDFKRWVTHRVLPDIRKYGIYATPQTVERILADPDTFIDILVAYKDQKERNEQLELDNARQRSQIEAMQPKALFADAVVTSNTSILVGEMAKILKQNGVNVGQNRLFGWLRRDGYLVGAKRSDWNMPTQKSMDLGIFEVKESTVNNPDGSVRITKTPKVTGKGQVYLVNKYCKKAS